MSRERDELPQRELTPADVAAIWPDDVAPTCDACGLRATGDISGCGVWCDELGERVAEVA